MFIRLLFIVVVVVGVFNENGILCSAIEIQNHDSPSARENRGLMAKTQDTEQKEIYRPVNNPDQDFRTSSEKKDIDLSKDNHRRPKFFGPLSFLAGVGAGSLASTSAAASTASLVGKPSNGAISIQFGPPPVEYLANLYNSPALPYIPYPYPVFYSFRDSANKLEQPKETEKLDLEEVRAEQSKDSDETVVSSTTERNFRKVVKDVEAVESDGDKKDAEPLLRAGAETVTRTANETMAVTADSNNSTNETEAHPFHGYYSDHPQDTASYDLVNENPHAPYFDDYIGPHYGVPAPEKLVPFNSYHHSYLPYHDSLSNYESPLDFYNADRYVYQTDSSRKFNGFKPMLR